MLTLDHLIFEYDFAKKRFSNFHYWLSMPVRGKEDTVSGLLREYRWLEGIISEMMTDAEKQPVGKADEKSLSSGSHFRSTSDILSHAKITYHLEIEDSTITGAKITIMHEEPDGRRLLALYDQLSSIDRTRQAAAAAEKVRALRAEGTPHAYIALLN